MPNVKILLLSHPFGVLGVTHRVHLWLDGTRLVDFLLAIIDFFSLALTAETLSEICRKQRFLKGCKILPFVVMQRVVRVCQRQLSYFL